ncbi:MAG: sulfurtransferase complex subunit TusD [Kangiellaceae bacterium]|jgi:tRNA 2-thiouridine synthesizing protein D|nr:sulfurtransferase complex subunit TusD [Kangiellaceae bacterium]
MSKSFTLLITGSPTASQAHLSAQQFIHAIYQKGHTVDSVFFYGEASTVANSLTLVAANEPRLMQQWQSLAQQFQFALISCISAANKRGVVSQEEAELNGLTASNCADGFKIEGLGSLASSLAQSDQLVHFS